MESSILDYGTHLRSLLETELTVANDNYTYPNTTLDVRLLHVASCRRRTLVCVHACRSKIGGMPIEETLRWKGYQVG